MQVLEKQYIFIIGAPRSGTTWLQTMMSRHPDVCTTVELTLFNAYVAPWMQTWETEKESPHVHSLPYVWDEESFLAHLRTFIATVYGRVLDLNPSATHIVDKQPAYAHHTAIIHRLLPQSRFIHMIRDGRDVVASMLHANRTMGFGPDTTVKAARMWKAHIIGARQAACFPSQYLEVKYEDLLVATEAQLSTILGYCGLDAGACEVTKIVKECTFENMRRSQIGPHHDLKIPKEHFRKGQAYEWRKDLAPSQLRIIDQIAGELLCDLGYERGIEWAYRNRLHRFLSRSRRVQKICAPIKRCLQRRTQQRQSTEFERCAKQQEVSDVHV